MHVATPVETLSAGGETESHLDCRGPSWELARLEFSMSVLAVEQSFDPNAGLLRHSLLEGGAKVLRQKEPHT